MRIAMVSGHACPRVQKMALPLIARGHVVHNISKKEPYSVNYYASSAICRHAEQYLRAIETYAGVVDIFHVHNEPSWFVQAIKERCDLPVVLDVHDSNLARLTSEEEDALLAAGQTEVIRVSTEERTNFQVADALVFPGEDFANLVCGEFKLTQPRLILPSYMPEIMHIYNGNRWEGGLVYEGRIDLPQEHKDNNHGFHYCDYLEFAKKCKELGYGFHIYPCRSDDAFHNLYKGFAHLHAPKDPVGLIASMQKHDWGLIGNLHYSPEWDIAMPNKMFEYFAANIPVVAINARAAGKFLLETGMGIVVDSVEELVERRREHTEVRKSVVRKRRQFVMERHIHKLEELYREVTCTPR